MSSMANMLVEKNRIIREQQGRIKELEAQLGCRKDDHLFLIPGERCACGECASHMNPVKK